jgi:hypothetical protein
MPMNGAYKAVHFAICLHNMLDFCTMESLMAIIICSLFCRTLVRSQSRVLGPNANHLYSYEFCMDYLVVTVTQNSANNAARGRRDGDVPHSIHDGGLVALWTGRWLKKLGEL